MGLGFGLLCEKCGYEKVNPILYPANLTPIQRLDWPWYFCDKSKFIVFDNIVSSIIEFYYKMFQSTEGANYSRV